MNGSHIKLLLPRGKLASHWACIQWQPFQSTKYSTVPITFTLYPMLRISRNLFHTLPKSWVYSTLNRLPKFSLLYEKEKKPPASSARSQLSRNGFIFEKLCPCLYPSDFMRGSFRGEISKRLALDNTALKFRMFHLRYVRGQQTSCGTYKTQSLRYPVKVPADYVTESLTPPPRNHLTPEPPNPNTKLSHSLLG